MNSLESGSNVQSGLEMIMEKSPDTIVLVDRNLTLVKVISAKDDYYHYFKSLHGNHLTSHVATCLKFGRISNADEKTRSVSVKAKEALMRISEESKLNELRMHKFNL